MIIDGWNWFGISLSFYCVVGNFSNIFVLMFDLTVISNLHVRKHYFVENEPG